jgi:hypothetical protein
MHVANGMPVTNFVIFNPSNIQVDWLAEVPTPKEYLVTQLH